MVFIFLFILVVTTFTTSASAFLNNVTDQQALLSLKASITSDPLSSLSSWNNSIHFCQWEGITCSRRKQRVTVLNLHSQQLVGTLSSHIGNLSFLREIYIGQNEFHGLIPNEFGQLFRLQHLSMGNNSFQGGFPSNLSQCANIRYISMFGMDLIGKLPTGFPSWSKLEKLNLGYNHFTGSIPPSLGNLSSLNVLDLRRNYLVGGIPFEIAHLAKLEILVFSETSLSGKIPLPLYNISSLISLDVDNNKLEGTLPADLGFTLPKLQRFFGADNRFSGPLPPSIANASNLVIFDIPNNNITGPLPVNLGSLVNLQVFGLGNNQLGDNQLPGDFSFFNSLVNCTYLYYLDLSENGLRGKLPKSIVNLSGTMEELHLYTNHMYGSIPYEIGKLVNMTRLSLQNNHISGVIPESIGDLLNLRELYLGKNNISGVIPTSFSKLTQLAVLSLQNNRLQGSIPTGLFSISTLEELDLSSNRLNRAIPKQIGQLSSKCYLIYLDQNLFTGSLPSDIGNLNKLVQLHVSNNQLTGNVPATLGDCVMLEDLRMDGNYFVGRIPPSFNALRSLVILDLSSNNLSENIPSFFDGFHLMEFLNLSHNKLGGEVPTKGLFSNVSAFSVTGNWQLCGGIQALQLPDCLVKNSRTKKKFPIRMIFLIVFLPLAILLGCLAFIFHRHRKSKQMIIPVPLMHDDKYPRLSYQDLLLATNEFSETNLLGEGRYGSVYKAVLESSDQTVAVKVLNVEVRGATKSFLAECDTLRNIRHRNLIKIITACSSTDFKGNDFKALVFEFMRNGSLDNWLHPSPSYQGNERNLTLLQRLNISIDVAIGLDYLHHHSHTSIIHCDIKPSNILLDEEFVARVGDFGLAKFSFTTTSDINQALTSSTGVRGTVGYVPPEYGMGGEISTEGDVYSYGILLLEMFSGKQPTVSNIFMDNGKNLHDYVGMALPHRVADIADPRIIVENQGDHGSNTNQSYSRAALEICLASIFEVGVLCSLETPKERLYISVAIKQLQLARDKLIRNGR